MKLSMTTREIAELTGKEHSNIVRDVKSMLTTLGFNPSVLKDTGFTIHEKEYRGRTVTDHIELDRDLTMTLVTGYDVAMRHRVMKRWRELEEKEAGAPMFIAKDVAEVLGYQNPSRSVQDHCKRVANLPTEMVGSLDSRLKLIPESDVYRLVMR